LYYCLIKMNFFNSLQQKAQEAAKTYYTYQ